MKPAGIPTQRQLRVSPPHNVSRTYVKHLNLKRNPFSISFNKICVQSSNFRIRNAKTSPIKTAILAQRKRKRVLENEPFISRLKPIFQLEGESKHPNKGAEHFATEKKTQKGRQQFIFHRNEPPLHYQKQTKNTLILKGHAHSKTFEHGKVLGSGEFLQSSEEVAHIC